MIIDLSIPKQPTDDTCGVSSLLGVYDYFGLKMDINELIEEVATLDTGGTLNVNLGLHALKQGFNVSLYTYNLQTFDPTWANTTPEELIQKLTEQIDKKPSEPKFVDASRRYIQYLENGGKILFRDLSLELLKTYLDKKLPIIAGLSSTFLYRSKREHPITTKYDDVGGYPAGHFVVVRGYSDDNKMIEICDPFHKNPFNHGKSNYQIPVQHFFASVYLGVVTYDANLLIISPGEK